MRAGRAGARTLARVAALLMAYAVLLGLFLIAPSAWVAPASADTSDVQVQLDRVSPAISGPGVEVQFIGSLTNLGTEPVPVHSVRVSAARRGLDTREAVSQWADEGSEATPVVLAEDTISSVLAPGARVNFFAQVPADTIDPGFEFATLPVRVEVLADADSGDPAEETTTVGGELRTFLPWKAVPDEAFNPIDIAWVAPLTLPGGTELVDPNDATRAAAWADAIGPQSRTTALLEGLEGTLATLVVDPALLEPLDPVASLTEGVVPPGGETPSAPPSQAPTAPATEESTEVPPSPVAPPPAGTSPATGTPGTTTPGTTTPGTTTPGTDSDTDVAPSTTSTGPQGTAPTQEPQLPVIPSTPVTTEDSVEALRARLAQLPAEQLWWLPVGDTDIGALLDVGSDPAAVSALVARPAGPDANLPGRTDVAWPLSQAYTQELVQSLTEVWAQAGGATGTEGPGRGTLRGLVLPGAAIATGPLTGSAVHPQEAGPLLIGYDEPLSGIVAASGDAEQDGRSVQRFLAETMAVYQQQPAADRSLVVAVPRTASPSADALAALSGASRSAPWLSESSLSALMSDAADLDPVALPTAGADAATTSGSGGAAGATDAGLTAYSLPGDSPLNPHRISRLEDGREHLIGASEIVPGSELSLATWQRVLDRQYSARWRQDSSGWAEPLERAAGLSTEILTGLHINPTTINFLADEGLIRITVTNDLPVQIEGLSMNVSPGNARLRILAQPEPITIGPDSRATVQFRARAIAAGQVPLNTSLTTPNGTLVGDVEKTQVRVQPTGVWIYWLLGGVAGVILVLGLVRALRPRPSSATSTATPAKNVATPGSDTEST